MIDQEWRRRAVNRMMRAAPVGLQDADGLGRLLDAALNPLDAGEWYFCPDAEHGFDTAREAVDDADFGEVVELSACVDLGRVYAASTCVTVDEEGAPDVIEAVLFRSESAAKAAWADSLELARRLDEKRRSASPHPGVFLPGEAG